MICHTIKRIQIGLAVGPGVKELALWSLSTYPPPYPWQTEKPLYRTLSSSVNRPKVMLKWVGGCWTARVAPWKESMKLQLAVVGLVFLAGCWSGRAAREADRSPVQLGGIEFSMWNRGWVGLPAGRGGAGG